MHKSSVFTDTVYRLSLKNMVWDPQKVQSDLKSQFGFNDLQTQHILNYSAELEEVCTLVFFSWHWASFECL